MYSQDQSQQYNLFRQDFSCAAPSVGLVRSGLEYTFSMTQYPVQGIQAYRLLPKWGIWGNTRNLQFSTHMLSRFVWWDVCECVYTKNLFPFLIGKLSSFASEEQDLQGIILVWVWGNLWLPHGLQQNINRWGLEHIWKLVPPKVDAIPGLLHNKCSLLLEPVWIECFFKSFSSKRVLNILKLIPGTQG